MTTVMLSIDEPAPNFTLPDQNGVPVELKSFSGKWVVVYFYPKDDTPGCTLEAVQFSRLADDLATANVVVLGISPDSLESHCAFEKKHDLKIRLLSDTEHVVLEAFGVWHLKSGFGKKYWGVVRSTYLIDPAGVIRRIWRDVQANGHAIDVKTVITDLQRETGK
jgi:thioredoxin-dependent peroxiredoxin